MMPSPGIFADPPSYAALGNSKGGSFWTCGGVDPAVGVFDADEARCAGAGDG